MKFLKFLLAGQDNILPLSSHQHVELKDRWIVCLNTDGSVRLDEGFATVRGFVSDQNGSWIIGFSIFLENYTVMEAELWGILDGLKLILDRGFERVLIQADSLEATTAIQEGAFGISNSTLLRRIDQILIKVKPWRIQHIPGRKTLLQIVLPR
ncbi:hypothetical protein Gotur_029925 [Gossypium turneri]